MNQSLYVSTVCVCLWQILNTFLHTLLSCNSTDVQDELRSVLYQLHISAFLFTSEKFLVHCTACDVVLHSVHMQAYETVFVAWLLSEN